jgi:hypothetical protein
MSQTKTKVVDENRPLNISEFCFVENLTPYEYYKMRRLGYAPEERRVPGTDIIQITPQARQEWAERLKQPDVRALAEQDFRRRSNWCKRPAKPGKKRGRPRPIKSNESQQNSPEGEARG